MRERVLRIVLVSLVLVIPLGIFFAPGVMAVIFEIVSAVAPVWLPILLAAILAPLWILYARSQFVASIPYTVLELVPGQDTPHTARAMELIFYSLYHRVNISRLMAILVGQVRLPWSFEIAASAGKIRFFMRVPTAHRAALESRIRAEYRDADLHEVQDYARETAFHPFTMKMVMREYRLTKGDPYPIRTYESREKSKDTVDPLITLLEELVAVGEKEHLFLSFIIRPHQRERKKLWLEPVDTLHQDAMEEIEHLVGAHGTPESLPEGKKNAVKAIEDALKKPAFDCGARALYMADRTVWKEDRARELETLLDCFAEPELNAFGAYDPEDKIGWPLSDIFKAVPTLLGAYLLNLYRRRAYFAPPYYGEPFVLNTAELATVYHLPYVTRASVLARARGEHLEPPDNLPVVA